MADETLFHLRGRIFLSPLEELKTIIKDNGVVVWQPDELEDLDRVAAIRLIDDWLQEEVNGQDKGATALLSLTHFYDEAQSVEPAVVKTEPVVVKTETDTGEPTTVKVTVGSEATVEKVRYHREFKISGQIDLKSGISFTSLIRQIESGLKKGYPEIEVVDGVIRAIPASSGLRNYLESRRDLGLGTLRGILRAHYLEKSATELYNELGSAAQGSKEGPSEFLMRTLDIRNKIVFSSQENTGELSYDPKLVHGLFVRTVDTGLQDTSIRQEFRSTLLKEGVQDEELIHELNQIVSREIERKSKLVKHVRRVEVQTVEGATSESDIDNHSRKDKSSKASPKDGILMAEVKALKAEMAEIKSMIKDRRNDNSASTDVRRRKPQQYGCHSCHDAGTGATCTHCWKCGSSEHFMRGCRASRRVSLPENGQRSRQGDES